MSLRDGIPLPCSDDLYRIMQSSVKLSAVSTVNTMSLFFHNLQIFDAECDKEEAVAKPTVLRQSLSHMMPFQGKLIEVLQLFFFKYFQAVFATCQQSVGNPPFGSRHTNGHIGPSDRLV